LKEKSCEQSDKKEKIEQTVKLDNHSEEKKKDSIEEKEQEFVKEKKENDEKVEKTRGEKALKEIIDLFSEVGAADYIGEPVTQVEHSCQAAEFARRAGYSEAVRLAALFHDIGHLIGIKRKLPQMGDVGTKDHELAGADYLRSLGFPENICLLVQKHVDAKRYLTFIKPDYYSKLSEASKKTLEYQGGRMDSVEASVFELNPLKPIILIMRTWDEKAKVVGWTVPDVASFSQMIISAVDGPSDVSLAVVSDPVPDP